MTKSNYRTQSPAGGTLLHLPFDLLHEPFALLRPVEPDSMDFIELRDSIEKYGLMSPISVRPSPRHEGKYEIIDGMWRYTACRALGYTPIEVVVKDNITDADVLAMQLHANAISRETKPAEYTRRLKRFWELHPEMTYSDMAKIAGKKPRWIKEHLNILKLPRDLQDRLDRGELPIASAYMLAKIPEAIRQPYVTKALAMKAKEFRIVAAGVIKQYMECVHQGRLDERYLPEFKPVAHIRGLKELCQEIDDLHAAAHVLTAAQCDNPLDAWKLALTWAVHLDPESIRDQEQKVRRQQRIQIYKESEAPDDPAG